MDTLEKFKEEIKLLVNSRKTYSEIATKYSVCSESVARFVRKSKIRVSYINESIFEVIDNEFKAYYLGLILADGSIYKANKSNSYCLELSLNNRDKYIIEKFRNGVCPTCKVYDKKSNVASIVIGSRKLGESIINNYGIKPRKTYELEFIFDFSKIPVDLIRHFIRGFFDGDGHFGTSSKTYTSKKTGITTKPSYIARIGFTSSHINFLHQISDKLKFLGSKPRIYTRDKYTNNLHMSLNKRNIILLYEYLYKDSNFFLHRKKSILERYLSNTEVTY